VSTSDRPGADAEAAAGGARLHPVLRLLPLLLFALMLVLGLLIEGLRYRHVLWETKLPLAAMLALAFWRAARPRPA
jgi:hypothetical protein